MIKYLCIFKLVNCRLAVFAQTMGIDHRRKIRFTFTGSLERRNCSKISERNKRTKYSVFFFIDLQKQGCCELVFGLLGNQKAFLGPQDWAQMTFRSEILLNKINNEFGRW